MCSFSWDFQWDFVGARSRVETWWELEKRQRSRGSYGWNHSVSDCHCGVVLPEDHRHSVRLLSLCWQWWTEGATYLLLSDRLAVSLKSTLSFGLSNRRKKKSTPQAGSSIETWTDKGVTDGWMYGWVDRDYTEEWMWVGKEGGGCLLVLMAVWSRLAAMYDGKVYRWRVG